MFKAGALKDNKLYVRNDQGKWIELQEAAKQYEQHRILKHT
ncbi:Uncharacterised protein [Paenibacillus polymyxa]|uniref:Uncharacterized protein n=1 Tax=Paenibacillus polymyxa TaxID=1406 RepID=A0A378Y1R0_PAEPO|nr:Uncharacterised protein [Paenibacillus polymyxa]